MFMIRKNFDSGTIAKERLQLLMETERFLERSSEMQQMKEEISKIVNRYLDLSSEEYEIKILMKNKR